jgi:hypothetical protein
MGSYLASVGLATRIGIFYSMQGIVSIFMPTLMGIVADKFIPAQRLLGFCHGIAGAAMLGAGLYGMTAGTEVSFGVLFGLYVFLEVPVIYSLHRSHSAYRHEDRGLDLSVVGRDHAAASRGIRVVMCPYKFHPKTF